MDKVIAGGIVGLVGCLFVVAIYAVCIAMGAGILLLGWNYGVAALWTVKTLHFWPAFALSALLAFLGGLVQNTTTTKS